MWLKDLSLWYRIEKRWMGEKSSQKRTVIIQIHPRSEDVQKWLHEILSWNNTKSDSLISFIHIYVFTLCRDGPCLNIYTIHKRKRWKWKEIKHRNEIMKAGNEKWYNRKFPIKIKSLLLQLYTAKLSSSSSF